MSYRRYSRFQFYMTCYQRVSQGCTPFIGPAQLNNSSSSNRSNSSSSNSSKKQKRSHSATAASTTAVAAVSSSTATAEVQEDAAVTVLWGSATGFKPDKKVRSGCYCKQKSISNVLVVAALLYE
jgi:hypothetical protein